MKPRTIINIIGISAQIDGMKTVYAGIRKNRPLLELGHSNLQNSLRHGQSATYMALHVLYHSTLVRARLHAVSSIRSPMDNHKDPAVIVSGLCRSEALF